MAFKTYTPKAEQVEEQWWLVDADGQILGRLASQVAALLRGKHRRSYSPHVDGGDRVVVVNAERVAVTGKKLEQKKYYRHSGYPGGLGERTLQEMLATHPERVIRLAVRGMLPRNRTRQHLMRRLKIYAGPEHPHEAQTPKATEFSDVGEESE